MFPTKTVLDSSLGTSTLGNLVLYDELFLGSLLVSLLGYLLLLFDSPVFFLYGFLVLLGYLVLGSAFSKTSFYPWNSLLVLAKHSLKVFSSVKVT